MTSNLSIGFIGYGEASYNISKGLHETSKPLIYAFDIMWPKQDTNNIIGNRAKECNVSLVPTMGELIEKADIILCATSAKSALSIAKLASEYLKPGKIYADINSASPMVKKQIDTVVSGTGADFVDCGVMDIIPPHRQKVPIAVSGSGARKFADFANSIGMNVTFINETAGSASTLKMLRSVFMKGLTSLLLEMLVPASKIGVEDKIMEYISKTFSGSTLEQLANLLINRTAVGASRRISEMKDVAATLKSLKVESFATEATIKRLEWVESLQLKDYFQGSVPKDYHEVLYACLKMDKSDIGKK